MGGYGRAGQSHGHVRVGGYGELSETGHLPYPTQQKTPNPTQASDFFLVPESTSRKPSMFEAIEARLRTSRVRVISDMVLPNRPIYSNDQALEVGRAIEYDAHEALCIAQARISNVEAWQWHTQRFDLASALLRVDISARHAVIEKVGGRCKLSKLADKLASPIDALSVVDMLSADAGLAASSLLAHLAEGEMGIDAVLGEGRERARWLSMVSQRRAVIRKLCDEQRHAFIAMWVRRTQPVCRTDPWVS